MSDTLDWNAKTIAEFRANEGRVGGNFEGAPMVLVHHRGRKSGREYVNPMMYLPHDTEPDIIYVFATKAGAPANPDWYHNLTAAGNGSVERGTEKYEVTVRELKALNATASTPSKRGVTPASPGTHAKPQESALFPCLNLAARSPHPKTGQRGPGDLRGTHPPYRLVAHRRPAADTPDSAPGSINCRASPSWYDGRATPLRVSTCGIVRAVVARVRSPVTRATVRVIAQICTAPRARNALAAKRTERRSIAGSPRAAESCWCLTQDSRITGRRNTGNAYM